MRTQTVRLVGCLLAILFLPAVGLTDEPAAASKASPSPSEAKSEKGKAPKFPEWSKVIEGTQRLEGVFPLYYDEKEQKLFMEIKRDQYNKDLILPISIARGAGFMFLGGDTLNFGDQWIISFKRSADRIHVVRRNVRVRAKSNSPQADAVKVSYTDSIIKALPIKSEQNSGQQVLVDLADLFMTDLAGIGVTPDRSRSSWFKVKAFPENVEIEVSAVFSMGYGSYYYFFGNEAVPDPRGTQVVIHYGLSMLPSSSYQPRLADDRVGHFLSTLNDFSKDVDETARQRYVARWHLEKDDPSAELSPPKKPIIFWIEKTVPREYRKYVREGILEWNKAFEKVGFLDAIQARDQQAGDDFEPEDIRYNTFRWITTSGGFAMGPSRWNPRTGQILDADIVFDEGMIRYWRQEFLRTSGVPEAMDLLESGHRQAFFKMYATEVPMLSMARPALNRYLQERRSFLEKNPTLHTRHPRQPAWTGDRLGCRCCQLGPGMQRQIGLMAAVMAARGEDVPGAKVPEEFIGQAVKEVVMHEVGHTLGLRHNFKASTMLTLEETNSPKVTHKRGMAGSVMDYLPANIALDKKKQGDYFSTTIGPYDYWAIEYAYKPVKEDKELEKIAAKAPQPELTYGTDEDMFLNPDPRINAFDLGDPLDYARQRIELVKKSLEGLDQRVVEEGEGWQRARTAFSMLMGELGYAAYVSAQYVGGEYTARDHRGDPEARPPMKPIPLKKQREALDLVQKIILNADAFQFSPELLRRLAPEHWRDDYFLYYGVSSYHYPVNESILSVQRMVLSRYLDPGVLQSLQEIQRHADPGESVLTMSEVFNALTDSVWSELSPGERKADEKIELSVIRRNLQREHLKQLAGLVLGPRQSYDFYDLMYFGYSQPAPPDARSLARLHLKRIDKWIEQALKKGRVGSDTSRAHLDEVHDQIGKILEASLEVNSP
jgi:hypothetical protein